MFSSFIDSMSGPSSVAEGEEGSPSKPQGNGAGDNGEGTGARGSPEGTGKGGFNLWSIAASVAENVKKSTADIAASVAETDWRAELDAFGKGVAEDGAGARKVAEAKLREGLHNVQHLPERLEGLHLREGPPVTSTPAEGESTPAASTRSAMNLLPASLGTGLEGLTAVDATHVQQHFTQVGSRLKGFGASFLSNTSELLGQVQSVIASEIDSLEAHLQGSHVPLHLRSSKNDSVGSIAKYSRLESDIAAMQRRSETYCQEPQDVEQYQAWLADFDLVAHEEGIAALIASNPFMGELESRIVPGVVPREAFWRRYFYALHKLESANAARMRVAERARQTSAADEVPLAWEDEDDLSSPLSARRRSLRGDVTSPQEDAAIVTPFPAAGTPPVPTEKAESQPRVGSQQTAPPPIATSSSHPDPEDSQSAATSPSKGGHASPETSTASGESGGQGPWTVVTSPKHGAPGGSQPATAERSRSTEVTSSVRSTRDMSPGRAISPRRGSTIPAKPHTPAASKEGMGETEDLFHTPKKEENKGRKAEEEEAGDELAEAEDDSVAPTGEDQIDEDWGMEEDF